MSTYNGAHGKSQTAEKNGIIIRPKECECCGSEDKLLRHHENYNLPIDISWLCDHCHRKRHTVRPSRIVPPWNKEAISLESRRKYRTTEGNQTLFLVRLELLDD